MFHLDLDDHEVAMLREIFESCISDLRMEIADTDSLDYRESLKSRKVLLGRLVDHLDRRLPLPAMSERRGA